MRKYSKKYNRILNDTDRDNSTKTIALFGEVCPGLLARKYPRANVQQAFGYERAVEFADKSTKILFVGCFEDTAYETLLAQGYAVVGIDPVINYDLAKFKSITDTKYSVILSISVIEHVSDDGQFIKDICNLLAPGGYAVITMDYRNSPGNKPVEDYRLYTESDYERLNNVLVKNGCTMLDAFDPTGEPDFQYGNCMYSFSTFVFRKEDDRSNDAG